MRDRRVASVVDVLRRRELWLGVVLLGIIGIAVFGVLLPSALGRSVSLAVNFIGAILYLWVALTEGS